MCVKVSTVVNALSLFPCRSKCEQSMPARSVPLLFTKTLSDEMDHCSTVITIQGHFVVENLPVGRPSGCGRLWYKEIAQLISLQDVLFLRQNQEGVNVSIYPIPIRSLQTKNQSSLASSLQERRVMYSLPLDV